VPLISNRSNQTRTGRNDRKSTYDDKNQASPRFPERHSLGVKLEGSMSANWTSGRMCAGYAGPESS